MKERTATIVNDTHNALVFFLDGVQKIESKLIIASDYGGTCKTSGSHDP